MQSFSSFIVGFFIICIITQTSQQQADFMTYEHQGPRGMEKNNSTTCEEFSKNARFNPYSVIGEAWMVFYYWATVREQFYFRFYVPLNEELEFLQKELETKVTVPVNWTAKNVLMTDKHNMTGLLVEQDDRGRYLLYFLRDTKDEKDRIEPFDLRFKQTGDNKYIGILHCSSDTVYVMSRLNDIPKAHMLHQEASKLGYKGRGGKSYLYQGNDWMPIGDRLETEFILHPEYKKTFFESVNSD